MELLDAREFTAEQWRTLYFATYSPDVAREMGMAEEIIASPPPLTTFFDNVMQKIDDEALYIWGVLVGDELVGYSTLHLHDELKEWEIGVVITGEELRGTGIGAKAAILTTRFAFDELRVPCVWAISMAQNEHVEKLLKKGGFRPFANFFIMFEEDWAARWRDRVWTRYRQ